ncbi:EAL domain-containing protein [Sphingorhabdus lutea]|uniref:sensor domain-containing protein n=1 Tax=Sphingorhabdus lutea TaxID=1913578 RepID=UPI001E53D0F5|nr:EAL domain-containing protein [Sphingorhabdus lutea]
MLKVQLEPVVETRMTRMLLAVFCGLSIFSVFFDSKHMWAALIWVLAGMLWIGLSYNFSKNNLNGHIGNYDSKLASKVTQYCIGHGILLSAGFLYFGYDATVIQIMAMWSICLTVIIFLPLLLPLSPRPAVFFNAILVISMSGLFIWRGEYFPALASLGISFIATKVYLQNAKSGVQYAFSAIALHEKSETVSLLLREFEDSGADWLWQTNKSREIVHASPRFAFAAESESADMEGQPFLKIVAADNWDSGTYPKELNILAQKLKNREAFSNLVVPIMMNGKKRWWELSASPKVDEAGKFIGFRGVGSNVTEQRESAQKISRLARYDNLTNLPNRLQLNEALELAMREAEKWKHRCAFLMIDLDRFKAVNDTLGHPVGDRLLAQVSMRLKNIMTPNELCGRLGGDEFAVVIRDARETQKIEEVATKIINELSKPYIVDQHTLFIGASIGSARGPVDGHTVELLMRSADLALYRAKSRGGNAHESYKHQLHAEAEEKRQMEAELRKAIERNEFHLEYQPVVNADNEHMLVGFEALVRWTNEKFGRVPPFKFIKVAEDARLIVPIGTWVLRQACKDAVKWPGQTKVAVNVSVDQLTEPGFIDVVTKALHDSGLPAYRLEIEVTEGIFLNDGKYATSVLERIRALGIKLSMDDFGTGYSSLGYLSNSLFDTIKVDRSFVVGAAQGKAESIAIIRAVVAMAQSLGLATTAEGVETEIETQMIQQLGCTKIQGYYFGRPMPFADSMELFENQNRRNVA